MLISTQAKPSTVRINWKTRKAKVLTSLAVVLPILSMMAGAALAAIQYGVL